MCRVSRLAAVKKSAPADETIAARVLKKEVPGAQFGQSVTERPPLNTVPTQLGPGDYDITAWES